MGRSCRYRLRPLAAMVLAGAVGAAGDSFADVVADGTVGPVVSLPGPEYAVGAELGRQIGANLFHSFARFNLAAGERATFSGPDSVQNIIGRVTGGQASHIDGTLRSTIPQSNLYFVNPAGVVFGPDALVDVPGSVHISTADHVRLGNDGRYDAQAPAASVLSSAPPSAFGFIAEQPAPIRFDAPALALNAGQTLEVVGGDITIADAELRVPGGRINLVSVGAPGEVTGIGADPVLSGFTRLGTISVSEQRDVGRRQDVANVDASGVGGGRIVIRAGELMMTQGFVYADTRGAQDGRGIDVDLAGAVTLRDGSRLTTDSFGAGAGGDLILRAGGAVEIQGSALSANAQSLGSGGLLHIVAPRLRVSEEGRVQVQAEVAASAGDLDIDVGELRVESDATLTTDTQGAGNGGSLRVDAHEAIVITGGRLLALTSGTGAGGDVRLQAPRIVLDDEGRIAASSDSLQSGAVGTIAIATELLMVQDAVIATDTALSGGGSIAIGNSGVVVLDNGRITSSVAGGAAGAGNVTIGVPAALVLVRGSRIQANAFGGAGGNLRLTAETLLTSSDSVIEAKSLRGVSGNVDVNTPDEHAKGIVAALATNYEAPVIWLDSPCGRRQARQTNRLLLSGRGGLVPPPGGLQAGFQNVPNLEQQGSGVVARQNGGMVVGRLRGACNVEGAKGSYGDH